MSKFMIVPSGWMVYALDDDVADVDFDLTKSGQGGTPAIAVMEALTMIGKAKRVAAVHTFNSMAGPSDDEEPDGDSPFYQGDVEE